MMVFTVYPIGEGRTCHRCPVSAYWMVKNETGEGVTCSAHLGSTIVQARRRGCLPQQNPPYVATEGEQA